MKKYFCSKCNEEKDMKDVYPDINTKNAFADPKNPEKSIIQWLIKCKKCNEIVLERKN